jgi:hypothetical protein
LTDKASQQNSRLTTRWTLCCFPFFIHSWCYRINNLLSRPDLRRCKITPSTEICIDSNLTTQQYFNDSSIKNNRSERSYCNNCITNTPDSRNVTLKIRSHLRLSCMLNALLVGIIATLVGITVGLSIAEVLTISGRYTTLLVGHTVSLLFIDHLTRFCKYTSMYKGEC